MSLVEDILGRERKPARTLVGNVLGPTPADEDEVPPQEEAPLQPQVVMPPPPPPPPPPRSNDILAWQKAETARINRTIPAGMDRQAALDQVYQATMAELNAAKEREQAEILARREAMRKATSALAAKKQASGVGGLADAAQHLIPAINAAFSKMGEAGADLFDPAGKGGAGRWVGQTIGKTGEYVSYALPGLGQARAGLEAAEIAGLTPSQTMEGASTWDRTKQLAMMLLFTKGGAAAAKGLGALGFKTAAKMAPKLIPAGVGAYMTGERFRASYEAAKAAGMSDDDAFTQAMSEASSEAAALAGSHAVGSGLRRLESKPSQVLQQRSRPDGMRRAAEIAEGVPYEMVDAPPQSVRLKRRAIESAAAQAETSKAKFAEASEKGKREVIAKEALAKGESEAREVLRRRQITEKTVAEYEKTMAAREQELREGKATMRPEPSERGAQERTAKAMASDMALERDQQLLAKGRKAVDRLLKQGDDKAAVTLMNEVNRAHRRMTEREQSLFKTQGVQQTAQSAPQTAQDAPGSTNVAKLTRKASQAKQPVSGAPEGKSLPKLEPSQRAKTHGYEQIEVDAKSLLERWRKTAPDEVVIGMEKQGYDKLKFGKTLEQPDVGIRADGGITMIDGRHRLQALVDSGAKAITVSVPKGEKQAVMQALAIPAAEGQYAKAQATVPPGMMGGVTGQPPAPALKRRQPKQARQIQTSRRQAIEQAASQYKLGADDVAEVAKAASAGRTTDIGKLTQSEGKKALKQAQLQGVIKNAGPEIAQRMKVRRPPEQEVDRLVKLGQTGAAEVKSYSGEKYKTPEGESATRKPLQRMKENWVYKTVGTGTLQPDTIVESWAGKNSEVKRVLIDGLAEGQHHEARIRTVTWDQIRKGMETAKFTQKQASKLRKFAGEKAPKVNVSPNLKNVHLDDVMTLVAATKNPERRAQFLKRGWVAAHGSGTVSKLTEADLNAAEAFLKTNHPELHAMVGQGMYVIANVPRQEVMQTFWRETGQQLKLVEDYFPTRRNPESIRGQKIGTGTEQLDQYMAEYMREASRQARRDAVLYAKQQRELIRKMPRGEAKTKATKELRRSYRERAAAGKPDKTRAKVYRSMAPGPEMPEFSNMSIVQARGQNKAPFLVEGFFDVIERHINMTSSYAAKALPVRDATLMLYNPEFRAAVRGGHANANAALKALDSMYANYKGMQQDQRGTIERGFNKLLNNASTATLGLRPVTMLIQTISLHAASAEIPGKYIRANLAKPHVTDAEIDRYFFEVKMRENSSVTGLLSPGVTPGKNAAAQAVWFQKQPALQRIGMGGIAAMDKWAIRRIVGSALDWAKDEGLRGPEMYNEARRRAMRAIYRTQPTSDPLSISNVQLQGKSSALAKTLTMFSSQPSKYVNMAVRALQDPTLTGWQKFRGVSLPLLESSVMVAALRSGYNLAFDYGLGMVTGEKVDRTAEDRFWKFMGDTVGSMYGGVIGVRDIIDAARAYYNGNPPRETMLESTKTVVGDAAGALILALKQWWKGEKYKTSRKGAFKKGDPKWEETLARAIPNTLHAIGILTGVPTVYPAQVARSLLKRRKP